MIISFQETQKLQKNNRTQTIYTNVMFKLNCILLCYIYFEITKIKKYFIVEMLGEFILK